MRYCVLGFNQQKIMDIRKEVKLDITDLLLLDYIWKAQAQPSMKHKIKNDTPYVWLRLNKIMEDLPILDMKKRALQLHLEKLEEAGLIERDQVSNEDLKGSKSYFCITDKCEHLMYSDDEAGVDNYTRNSVSGVDNYTRNTPPDVNTYTSDSKIEKIDNILDKDKKIPQKLFKNSSKQSSSGPDQVVEMYNDICKELPKVRSLTPKRKTVILKVLNKYGMDTVKEVFKLTSQSDFLLGNNNRGWSADFNWLMKEDNFIKVLEGNYNKKKREQSRDGLVTRRANREEDEAFIEKLRQEGEKVEY